MIKINFNFVRGYENLIDINFIFDDSQICYYLLMDDNKYHHFVSSNKDCHMEEDSAEEYMKSLGFEKK